MNNVVIKSQVQAFNVDAYNRTAVATVDLENGSVFALNSYSTNDGEEMVWKVSAPAANGVGLWMATSPEVVITKLANGEEFKGLTPDPRAFINYAGKMIDATKLCAGDIIEMTCANIENVAAKDYLVANGAYALEAADAAGAGFAMKKIGTSRLHIGQGGIAPAVVPTYKFEVVNN